VARASASCSTTTPSRWWSVCQTAVTVCWSWSAPTAARSAANGETATEDGIDDIEENVATDSADKINTAQPELIEKYPHAHQGPDAGSSARPGEVHGDPILGFKPLLEMFAII
jgi:hypothetical protein